MPVWLLGLLVIVGCLVDFGICRITVFWVGGVIVII